MVWQNRHRFTYNLAFSFSFTFFVIVYLACFKFARVHSVTFNNCNAMCDRALLILWHVQMLGANARDCHSFSLFFFLFRFSSIWHMMMHLKSHFAHVVQQRAPERNGKVTIINTLYASISILLCQFFFVFFYISVPSALSFIFTCVALLFLPFVVLFLCVNFFTIDRVCVCVCVRASNGVNCENANVEFVWCIECWLMQLDYVL